MWCASLRPPHPPIPPHSRADVEVHLSRFHVRQLHSLRIQSAIRRLSAIRFLARCRVAAIRLQSAARRLTAIRLLARCRIAAIHLQSAARRWSAWREIRRRRTASLRISRMAKGVKPRRLAQRRREAATLIGRVARGRVTRILMLRLQLVVTARGMAVPSLPRMGSMASFGSMKSLGSMKSFRERRGSLTVPLTGSVKHRLVARSNTLPVRGERRNERGNGLARDKAKEVSRACVIS